ncbi:S8 family serine peptidase [Paenibacillus sp. N3.4]|uniref:S8 family serine peptidase n=1 Tax=Paenibacillus sp. N3.4 TaxID=2603222 RepID=UPI0011C79B8E|nr:S8 family serine peptidase [Paenibacillus sp. N3.4]TXK75434.1 S8 family serine peptidase [Paenibacillus sp. N3.4]
MIKRIISILLVITTVFTIILPTLVMAESATNQSSNDNNIALSSYIIKFKDITKGKQNLNKRNKKIGKSFKHLSSHTTTMLSDAEVEDLKKDSNVAYIEKDSIVSKAGDIVPVNLKQIHVPEVHDLGNDGTGVKVAVLDTGVNTKLSELHVSGGISLVPNDATLGDTNGHGTFVAGILAAHKDNQGFVGVAPNVSLYDVKVLDGNGNGAYSQVIQGIDWAIENHMDVVSMSFTGGNYSAALEEATQLAYSNGILLVAATGNDGTNNVSYPAKFSSVIGVGAVDGDNQLASFSNTGAEVELVAPGVRIQGLSLNNTYTSLSGTSISVPQVAGVAALIKYAHPTYSNQDIRKVMNESATSLGDKTKYGNGLVNAAKALQVPEQVNDRTTPVTTNNKGSNVSTTVSAVLTIPWLSQQFAVSEEEILSQLNKGYSLQEINQALQAKSQSNPSLADLLTPINPSVQEHLKQLDYSLDRLEPKSTTYTPSYTNDPLQSVLTNTYSNASSVTTDTYNVSKEVSIAANIPTSYDDLAVKRMYTNVDNAPYSVSSGKEDISTLSGSLQLKTTDMVLPGRNGLSFALNRIYDSSTAQYYDKQAVFTHYRTIKYMPEFRAIVEMWQGGDNYTFYQDTTYYMYLFVQRNGSYYQWNNPSPQNVMEFGDFEEKKRLEATTYKARNKDTDEPFMTHSFQINGVTFRAKLYPTGYLIADPSSPILLQGYGYYNYTSVPNQESKFPIGKGWRWDIPYIETQDESKDGKNYLHLFGGATYEMDNQLNLKGNPWKDLVMQRDYSIADSCYMLTALDGTKQFFSCNGKLTQIKDVYNNTIQFQYDNISPYGSVLRKIKDEIGNEINIDYKGAEVTLTMGDRTVKYVKTKDTQGNKDLLSTVTDAGERTTRYTYDTSPAPFDLVGADRMKDNYVALLKDVYHPTNAHSEYTYEPFTRNLGPQAKETAYRVKSREDVVDYQDGSKQKSRHVDFAYVEDGGANFRYNYEFSTTVKDGLTQTTYTYKKQYIDDTTPQVYYNKNITQQAGTDNRIINQTFDETKRLPVPIEVTTSSSNGTLTSQPITIKRTFDDYGNLKTETNTLNIITTYEYLDKTNFLKSVNQPVDESHSKLTDIQRNDKGSVTTLVINEKDAQGKLTLMSQVNYEDYDSVGNAKKVTIKDDGRNIVINRDFDLKYRSAFLTNQSIKVLDAEGKSSTVSQSMEYNLSTGQIASYTDDKKGITKYTYDKLGRLTLATFGNLNLVTNEYNDANNQITSTDPTGVKTITKWNPLGLKESIQIVGAGTGKQSFQYDDYSRLWKSQDARGITTEYRYDPWNRVKEVIYPDASESVEYDDINRTKTTKDGEQNRLRETYDILGRTIEVGRLKTENGKDKVFPVSSVKKYDYVGHALEVTDADATHISIFGYDVLGRLTSVKDANNDTTAYKYSLANQVKEVKFPDNNKVLKEYDEMGRLIKKTDLAQLTDKYFYDGNSNLIKHVDRKGQTIKYEYNSRDLLTKNISPNETISYDYDNAGRRLWMKDGTNTTSYQYYPATGLLDTMTYQDGRTIKYSYGTEGLGNRVEMTDPFSIKTVYGYEDKSNRLKGIGDTTDNWEASYKYKKNGLADITTQKNGITNSYTFDGANLTNLVRKKNNGDNLYVFGYVYDNNANQTSKTENSAINSFTYDKLNRIDTSSGYNEQYTYDSRGNRQTLQSSSQVLDIAGVNYEYDDRNRLMKVSMDDGKVVSYKYNGDGLLYERTENGQTTRYYYDGANLVAEGIVAANGTATLKARYIRGNGLVARVDASENKTYYQHNGHGDVVGLTDAAGKTLNTYKYDIWGNPLITEEAVQQPFRYSGEFYDNTTGLQYLRARWYDPTVGRFINEDTYEGKYDNPLTLNLYTYTTNNPLRWIDPSGHANEVAFGGGGGVGFGAIGAGGAAVGAGIIVGTAPTPVVDAPPPTVDNGPTIYITVPAVQQSATVTQTTFGEQRPTIITTPFQDQTPTVITTPFVKQAPTILQSSAGWTLSSIAGKYGNCQCAEAANDMKSYLLKNGLNGEQVSIKYNSPGFIVSDTYGTEAISQNGYHTGILYQDKVYDNIHTKGISYQDWLNDFYGVGNRTITRTSINQGG